MSQFQSETFITNVKFGNMSFFKELVSIYEEDQFDLQYEERIEAVFNQLRRALIVLE